MFAKGAAAQLRKEFWTTFGLYMMPLVGAEGEKINWINYRTGEKDIFFRLHADTKSAVISIELTHKDEELRSLYFEQFIALKEQLHTTLQEQWVWEKFAEIDGKPISRISKILADVNILDKKDWPAIISFFKQRMVALDVFWNDARYFFESLR